MKLYCQKCGNPNEYVSTKPNFCSRCGNSFASTSSNIRPKKNIVARYHEENEDEDADGIEVDEVPNISKLDFEFQKELTPAFSLSSLIGTGNGNKEYPENSAQIISKEDFLKQFKMEAGSLKK